MRRNEQGELILTREEEGVVYDAMRAMEAA